MNFFSKNTPTSSRSHYPEARNQAQGQAMAPVYTGRRRETGLVQKAQKYQAPFFHEEEQTVKEFQKTGSKIFSFEIAKSHNGSKQSQNEKNLLQWANDVMEMYGKDMDFFSQKIYDDQNERFSTAWNYWKKRKPIIIYPYVDTEDLSASYSRLSHPIYGGQLKFGQYPNQAGKIEYTSHNEDIVSHETGHAFLDNIRPDLYYQVRLQTRATHESFGDLSCVFYQLSKLDRIKQLFNETSGNLDGTSFVTLIGEPLGETTPYGEIRDVKNDVKMGQAKCKQHDLSRIFSAIIYELILHLFKDLKMSKKGSRYEMLFQASKYLRLLLLQSLIEIPYDNFSFSDIGWQMVQIAETVNVFTEYNFSKKIKEVFFEKKIDIDEPHKDFDEICKVTLPQQPNQSRQHPFCGTFAKEISKVSKKEFQENWW